MNFFKRWLFLNFSLKEENISDQANVQQPTEQTLRQKAIARLKMFNFHINWDLHMTQCKPCR